MRGRRPKPTALKKLQGNPGRRPLPANEPQPPPGQVECPEWISKTARQIWDQYAPMLIGMRVLTRVDQLALANLCEQAAHIQDAMRQVKKSGMLLTRKLYNRKGEEVGKQIEINPAFSVQDKAMRQLRSLLVEFGMTPSARARVSAFEANYEFGQTPHPNELPVKRDRLKELQQRASRRSKA